MEGDAGHRGGFENEIEPGMVEAGFIETEAGEVKLYRACAGAVGKFCDDVVGVWPVAEVDPCVGFQWLVKVHENIESDDMMFSQAVKRALWQIGCEAEVGAFKGAHLNSSGGGVGRGALLGWMQRYFAACAIVKQRRIRSDARPGWHIGQL